MYRVYIKLKGQYIHLITSDLYHNYRDLLEQGYIYIDEGDSFNIYGNAEYNYLQKKFNKPIYDNDFFPNFKYINGKILLVSDEEKKAFKYNIDKKPNEQEIINADIYLQLAILQEQNKKETPIVLTTLKTPRYSTIKKYYDLGLYTEDNLELFVQIGWILKEEKDKMIIK